MTDGRSFAVISVAVVVLAAVAFVPTASAHPVDSSDVTVSEAPNGRLGFQLDADVPTNDSVMAVAIGAIYPENPLNQTAKGKLRLFRVYHLVDFGNRSADYHRSALVIVDGREGSVDVVSVGMLGPREYLLIRQEQLDALGHQPLSQDSRASSGGISGNKLVGEVLRA